MDGAGDIYTELGVQFPSATETSKGFVPNSEHYGFAEVSGYTLKGEGNC
jgi:hypothetical protein